MSEGPTGNSLSFSLVVSPALITVAVSVSFSGVIVGGVIGVRKVMQIINDKKQAQELQKQLEELSESEDDQAP